MTAIQLRRWVSLPAVLALALAFAPASLVAADTQDAEAQDADAQDEDTEEEGDAGTGRDAGDTDAGDTDTGDTDAGDADPEDWDNFTQEVLNEEVQEAMALAVLPDGRVLHNARSSDPEIDDDDVAPFRLYDPETGESPVIAELPVYSFSEYGAQGIALDPDFEDNGWIYLYYTPPGQGVPEGEAPEEADGPEDFEEYQGVNVLSRFDLVDGDEPTIDLDSEQVLLEVEQNLGMCCHLGGDIDFDSEGNLYLSTGDDTSAFGSDDFTPIDERETSNPGFDAQRTSANTASLAGKLLRITPQDDGSYTVPDDNMFNSGAFDDLFPDGEYDEELAPPEIYAMGLRNPFRFSVDPVTDNVYLGDYGPDAPEADPERGPEATVSWHIISEPVNIGWPYCIGDNVPFVDYDFETGASGEPFDCEGGPINDSPRNTGLEQLPPVTPAEVWDFNFSTPEEFPELGEAGGAPMGGPVYRYDEDVDGIGQFPEFYDGAALYYEWNEGFIKPFVLDEDGESVEEIRDLVPDWEFTAPMDMEFGPDGSLYLLEYGSGFFVESTEARLSRISFDPDAEEPGQPAPPQPVQATLDPSEPDGENGWYVSEVELTLTADDEDAELQWRLDETEDWQTWTEPVAIDADGAHTVEYRALFAADDDGDADGDEGDGDGEVETDVEVELTNFEFTPDDVTVAQGGTVTFQQVAGAHNVLIMDEDGELVDGEEEIGGWETYEFSADEAGTYTFDCTPHAGMDGTLEVVADDEGDADEADADEAEGEEDRGDVDASDTFAIDVPIDRDGPVTSASFDDPANDEVTLTLDASDEVSGVVEIHVREDGEDDHGVYTDPITAPADQSFEVRAIDEAGNAEDWQTVASDGEGGTTEGGGIPTWRLIVLLVVGAIAIVGAVAVTARNRGAPAS